MYEAFYGLREMPFSVMPDPRYAYRSLNHKIAEGRMRFAADYQSGLAVLTGPVGCGKTTCANMLVADWADDATKAVAYLPTADDRGRSAFLRLIMDGFGVQSARNYADNKRLLERFLLEEYKAGRHAILVIDEAQKIHSDNFDVMVDLTNFQTATEKFITLILIGQDTFSNKLRMASKDAFCSRIAFTGHLDPLSYEDAIGMIGHRLTVGGALVASRPSDPGMNEPIMPDLRPLLDDEAVVEVYKITKGVPRDICVFLSSLFLDGYITNHKPIPAAMVRTTLSEMSRMKKWPVEIKEQAK